MKEYEKKLTQFGLGRGATLDDICARRRYLAKRLHPDMHDNSKESNSRFRGMQALFEYLEKHYAAYHVYRLKHGFTKSNQSGASYDLVVRSEDFSLEQASPAMADNFWDLRPQSDAHNIKTTSLSRKLTRLLTSSKFPLAAAVAASFVILYTLSARDGLESETKKGIPKGRHTLVAQTEQHSKQPLSRPIQKRVANFKSKLAKEKDDDQVLSQLKTYWPNFYSCIQQDNVLIPHSGTLDFLIHIKNDEVTRLDFRNDSLQSQGVRSCLVLMSKDMRLKGMKASYAITFPIEIIIEPTSTTPSA